MIDAGQLADIAGWLQRHGSDESRLPRLRQRHPDIHFTWCTDDDVGCETAVLESEKFNLYLVDGREHCLRFTSEHEAATGVVIAELTEA